jgi:hypothetical protein
VNRVVSKQSSRYCRLPKILPAAHSPRDIEKDVLAKSATDKPGRKRILEHTYKEVREHNDRIVASSTGIVLGMPLQDGNANLADIRQPKILPGADLAHHSTHHANDSNLKPCLATQPVKEEYRDPSENEKDDSDATSRKVRRVWVRDATFLIQSRGVVQDTVRTTRLLAKTIRTVATCPEKYLTR